MIHTIHSNATHKQRSGDEFGRWIFLAITLLIGALLAAVAPAQPARGQGCGHHCQGFGAQAGHRPGPMLFGVDEDGDGVLSGAEFQSFLAEVDANADGVLAHEELMALRQAHADEAGVELPENGPMHERMRDHIMQRLDQNEDGLLQTAEVETHFAELDANGDGDLSGDEMPMHGRHRRTRHHMAAATALRAADADQDRNVTASEWSDFLATVDADGDGRVTFEELHTRANPDFEPPSLTLDEVNEVFNTLDANGDGTVSEDELPPRRHHRRGPRGPRGGG